MRTLFIIEQGTRLTKEGGELELTRGGRVVQRSRLGELEQVVLAGTVEITPAAIHACLRRGIDVSFVTLKGRYRGRISGPGSRFGRRRLCQYRAVADPERRIGLAREIVRGKILNQRSILLRHQRRLRDEGVAAALAGMRRMIARLDGATTIEEAMGCEGQASALYFGSFGLLITNPEFDFHGRNRRPPRDPVNAALSFGYALLLSHLDGIVQRVGLDPALGTFHEIQDGRPSLTLDIMEEFRPLIVDRSVLRVLNRRQLTPRDFRRHPPVDPDEELAAAELEAQSAVRTADAGPATDSPSERTRTGSLHGIYLGDTGRRILITAFFSRLRERLHYAPRRGAFELGDILEMQVRTLAAALETPHAAYSPFVPR